MAEEDPKESAGARDEKASGLRRPEESGAQSSLSGEGCPPPSFGASEEASDSAGRDDTDGIAKDTETPAASSALQPAPMQGAGQEAKPSVGSSAEAGDFVSRAWALFWETLSARYWNFSGRAGRTEFWVFFVGGLLISAVLNLLSEIPFIGPLAALASVAWWFASLIPTWAVAFRRLHDTGRSGWWISGPLAAVFAVLFVFPASIVFAFLSLAAIGPVLLIAGVLFIVALVFCALPGEARPNAWGEPPADPGLF